MTRREITASAAFRCCPGLAEPPLGGAWSVYAVVGGCGEVWKSVRLATLPMVMVMGESCGALPCG